jgi:hypothetical protein
LDIQINVNHCKCEAHEKFVKQPVFFLSRRQNTWKKNQPNRDMINQRQQKNKTYLANNTNEVQIIEISTNPTK